MAELLKCNICGFKTVRCAMSNHLKRKHPKEWAESNNDASCLTQSLGKVKCEDLKRIQKEA